jgi:hypothetical protein
MIFCDLNHMCFDDPEKTYRAKVMVTLHFFIQAMEQYSNGNHELFHSNLKRVEPNLLNTIDRMVLKKAVRRIKWVPKILFPYLK